jgi:hypothetical protein
MVEVGVELVAVGAVVLEQQCLHGRLRRRLSSEEEWESEFIVVLNGDPLGIHRLPDKFDDFVVGRDVTVGG